MHILRCTAHLIYGPTAAGKSTYAKWRAAEVNGVRFAIDRWMHALFGAEVPERMDLSWVMPRVSRCKTQIWAVAERVLNSGTGVVQELGLVKKWDRDSIKEKVEHAGHAVGFHFVDAELPIRRQRVLTRNAEKGETWSFEVTPAMFDAMESYFERPSANELAGSRIVQALHA